MKLSETLKTLMARQNLRTAQLARATGVLQPVLHRMASGATDNPRVQTLLPLADYFDVSIKQLLGLTPLPDVELNIGQVSQQQSKIPLLTRWQDIVIFLAGSPQLSNNLVQTELHVGALAYAITVKDSTMQPQFPEGSTLLVAPSIEAQNGDFVIVQLPGTDEPSFKQMLFDVGETHFKPLNPEFKTIIISNNEPCNLLGVVLECRTHFKG
jgi:SOS-response transcriptional repressor LexA